MAEYMRAQQEQSPSLSATEATRAQEIEKATLDALRKRGAEIVQAQREGKPPSTNAEKALHFFGRLQDKDATPEIPPQAKSLPETYMFPPGGNPIKLRMKESGSTLTILDRQTSVDGEDFTVTGIVGRREGMILCATEKQTASGGKDRRTIWIPEADLMTAQLAAEKDTITQDTKLVAQKGLLDRHVAVFRDGSKTAGSDEAFQDLTEGLRQAGKMNRGTLEAFAKRFPGRNLEDKLNRMFSGEAAASGGATGGHALELMRDAGMFDRSISLAMAEQSGVRARAAEQLAESATRRMDALRGQLSHAEGAKIQVGGAEVEVTAALKAQWQTELDAATVERDTATKEAASAIAESDQFRQQAELAKEGKMEELMKTYLDDLDKGDFTEDESRKFLTALESGDEGALFDVLVAREMKKAKDEEERQRLKKIADEKREKFKGQLMAGGAIALMLLMMMLKDGAASAK